MLHFEISPFCQAQKLNTDMLSLTEKNGLISAENLSYLYLNPLLLPGESANCAHVRSKGWDINYFCRSQTPGLPH